MVSRQNLVGIAMNIFRFLCVLMGLVAFNLAAFNEGDTSEKLLRHYYVGQRKIDFYSNYPIDIANHRISKIIIAVHGTLREASGRFDAVYEAVKSRGQESHVLVIAPRFKTVDDSPEEDDYFWSSVGWKQGNTSNNGVDDISSFQIIDSMVENIVMGGFFLGLSNISITGHSAGGQYTEYYALTSPIPSYFSRIAFDFLVANPSNYPYLDEFRPHPTMINSFYLPESKQSGNKAGGRQNPANYNNYKYGLDNRNAYSKHVDKEQLKQQFLSRKVYYVLGKEDNLQDKYLDASAAAKMQGKNRLERGQNFYAYINRFYPDNQHKIVFIEGVGHDADGIYGSEAVRNILLP